MESTEGTQPDETGAEGAGVETGDVAGDVNVDQGGGESAPEPADEPAEGGPGGDEPESE